MICQIFLLGLTVFSSFLNVDLRMPVKLEDNLCGTYFSLTKVSREIFEGRGSSM